MSPTCSARIFTPSTSTASSAGHSSRLSSEFADRSEADHPSRTRYGTPGSRASSTPVRLSENEMQNQFNPDIPLPSVERDVSSTSSRQSPPSTAYYTPSLSSNSRSTEQAESSDADLQEIAHLSNMRLASPEIPVSLSQRASRTPSIHVTPSAPPNDMSQSSPRRDDSIVNAVGALRLNEHRADSLDAVRPRESCSPSPSGRRRSGSGIRRERHQIESESPPEAFKHMAEVQEALAEARTQTRRIATVLSSSSLHHENGSSIQNLYQQAMKLNNFQLPSSRIVGLVGDSGVGKTSLINSLLDRLELARASGTGAAVTCAVTEYHFHERDDFAVNVDYYSLDELKKQFEELLRAYRDFQLLPEHGNDSNEAHISDNERPRLQKKAELAMQMFSSSFGGRLHGMPGILSSTPFEHAIATMVEWATQLLPQQAERKTFDTVEECSSWLKGVASETHSSFPNGGVQTCWPFIQKVRVYLKAYILSKGLIIADLPGLRDVNSARQAITERYIRQCHQIFVVAEINRAITNESIKHICDLASRVNLSKVDIVCTKSENIQTREAYDDWPEERVAIEEIQRDIADAYEDIESLKEEIAEYDQDIANLTREEARQLSELQRDQLKAEKAKESREFDFTRLIVKLRNDKVSRGLQKEYHNHPVATSLGVFCVSNKVYGDYREKAAVAALPYLEYSGILELRRYCIGLVAQSRLQAIQTFIKDEIPALVGSVEIWVEAGSGNASAESKQRVLDAVAVMEQELDKLTSPVSRLSQISRTLEAEFNNEIYTRMRQNGPQWSGDARQASLSWEGWHQSSYAAFCSNSGDHWTKSKGHHCWNAEAIQGMATDLSAVWSSFELDLNTEIQRVNTAAIETYDKVIKIASSTAAKKSRSTDDTGPAMRTFTSNLLHRERLTCYGIERATETFEADLDSLRTDALSSAKTAFIGKLMSNTYHAANMEYGRGSDRRRKDLITARFSSPTLFNEHRNECREAFRELAREFEEKMIQVIEEQSELVEADLQLLKDGHAITESERDVGFKIRVRDEARSVKEEVERLGRVVGEA